MKTRRTLSAVLAVMIALAILVSCASTGKNNSDTSKATKFKLLYNLGRESSISKYKIV